MRVLVCGGRLYNDRKHVDNTLDWVNLQYGPVTCIVTGACCDKHGNPRGADWWAELWARKNAVRYVGMPADFNKFGKPAGPIRNRAMLVEQRPQLVVAFPGGDGTADMIAAATEIGFAQVRVNGGARVLRVRNEIR